MTFDESDESATRDKVLSWCGDVLGPVETLSDHSRHQDSDIQATFRIATGSGVCYVKIHEGEAEWLQEVHGYEQWARAFGDQVPRLIAVRDEYPFAVVVSERPGQVLEEVELAPEQEREVWRSAGQALVALHGLAVGEFFGGCKRDGTCAGRPYYDAEEYVSAQIQDALQEGLRAGCLDEAERAVVGAGLDLAPAFAGQRPVPCHGDYCPANWLVTGDGAWAGPIDFERAHWDLAVIDYTRDPHWTWSVRPDLMEAFFAGYGYDATPQAEQRRLVSDICYALDTVVWAHRVGFRGSLREGRAALAEIGARRL